MGVAESFRNPQAGDTMGVQWSRLMFSWNDVQPDGPGDFSRLGLTLGDDYINRETGRGTRLAGLFQFTPPWAQRDPQYGQRSVPKNLDLPVDHPENYWARYVERVVGAYRGRVDEWILWNEPDFRPTDPGAGGSYTWAGNDQEFARLMKVGYLAAKRANPNATVAFAGTAYWVEELAVPKRVPFYERILRIFNGDPEAAANNHFHDAVALNLYQSPDSIVMVHTFFEGIQQRAGIRKPVWLTETNAMPTDDTSMPCSEKYTSVMPRVRMEEQAAFVVQAYALAAAAGYERIEFYKMDDGNVGRASCGEFEPAVWGVARDDGRPRPVLDSLRTAIAHFRDAVNARFVPYVREAQNWAPWPDDPLSYYPNWQIYQVAIDKADGSRVTVIWNGDGQTLRARVPIRGGGAQLMDKRGNSVPLNNNGTHYVLDLPGATARGEVIVGGVVAGDPPGYHFIGGDPLILIEQGVGASAPVTPPAPGEGGAPDFALAVNPEDGQTVGRGQAAEFFIRTIPREGLADPISLRIREWSSQRFPAPKDPNVTPLPFTVIHPESVNPGETIVVRMETANAAEGGIYFFTFEATAGGITHTFDLALVLV